ncbi:MAG: helix-turn-helix domain-containing protein [Armatimonadota bacterium]
MATEAVEILHPVHDYRIDRAARYLDVSEGTIRRMIKTGQLDAYAISDKGTDLRITHESIMAFRSNRRVSKGVSASDKP